MKRVLLLGGVGAGKTSLSQALSGVELRYKKTQSIEVSCGMIDTPGEYVEHRGFYRALMSVSTGADIILLLQSCTDSRCVFAPGFSSMFTKPVIGVAAKADLTDAYKAEQLLKLAGCRELFTVSCVTGDGIRELRERLEESAQVRT